MQTSLSPERQRQTLLKVSWRLLPLIAMSYLVAYIDRTNVSFAALTMNPDLGLSAYLYGWGAGIFFLGYALFEVPSNMILQRTGARVWIARIMITWGIVSGLMAAVTGPASFLALRFLLGVAEAGFFPGIILYLTYWFPEAFRGRAISILYVAVPLSNAIASVVSGLLLQMDGMLGLKGWQWIFIIEAIPAVLLGFVVMKWMTNRPAEADWLAPEERDWLESELQTERDRVDSTGRLTVRQSLTDPRVIALSLIYLTNVTASYGIVFFMPQIVKGLGLSNLATGFVTAIPYVLGLIGLLAWGHSSDRRRERRWHLICATLLAALGFVWTGWMHQSYWAIGAMALVTIGIYGCRPSFWPMPSFFLSGPAAAAGLALINSIGNLGGYAGPFVVGWIRDSTRSFEAALYFLAGCAILSAIIAMVSVRATRAEPRSGSMA
ncbi:MAG: MFS transporter [Betaproteobacteria bacterium]|jgi:ACS family tartrate transporter-like MFS transporter